MNARQMYDRYARPHLPKAGPYAAHLRDGFCDNAEEMLVWVVDAQSEMLRRQGTGVPTPVETLANHIMTVAPVFAGRGLTSAVNHDRLAIMVDDGDRTMFGRMMIELAVLHMVRAADAVAVGIANDQLPQGARIDVTSPARGSVTQALAHQAARQVIQRLAQDMPRIDDIAYAAAASWTRRSDTVH